MDPTRYYRELTRFFEEEIQFNRFLGLRVDALSPGVARLRLPFRPEFVGDPFRPALHGGVLSTLLDTVGGLAVFTRLRPGDQCSTVDLRVDYLDPGPLADLTAEGRVLRMGNRVAVVTLQAWQDDPERPVADGKGVYNVRRKREG